MLAVAEASRVSLTEAVEAASWVAASGHLVVLVKTSEATAEEVELIAASTITVDHRAALVRLECVLLRGKCAPMPSGPASGHLPTLSISRGVGRQGAARLMNARRRRMAELVCWWSHNQGEQSQGEPVGTCTWVAQARLRRGQGGRRRES